MTTSPLSKFVQQLRNTALLRRYSELTDGQLLDDFVHSRESEALETLVGRHAQMVWGVCRRVLGDNHDAEDAFQATFLVFVRKAASICSRAKVGNWLYGVAHQTALRARGIRAKREVRQRMLADIPEPTRTEHDLECLLDQELSRLPEKYRTVIVLCGLEGKTKREAAEQLGLPEGTVATRVARGKTLLAKRLRWPQLSGAASASVLGMLMARNSAYATVPKSLTKATIKAASMLARGQNPANAASSGAVSLAEGVVKAMFATKIKALAAMLLAPLVCAFLIINVAQSSVGNQSGRQEAPAVRPRLENGTNSTVSYNPTSWLPPKDFKLWRDAGAEFGWMRMSVNNGGFLEFLRHDDRYQSQVGDLPAFRFTSWTEGILANLPIPEFSLGLVINGMTDTGLKDLAGLKNLRALHLLNSKVTDDGLKELAGLTRLQSLHVPGAQVTDQGLQELASMKDLQSLSLFDANITDRGLSQLARLTSLRALDLCRTKVTNLGMKELARMKHLQFLFLSGTQVTDKGLKYLANLKNLCELHLNETSVTDNKLQELAKLKSLQLLDLSETYVSAAGVAQLQIALPECYIKD